MQKLGQHFLKNKAVLAEIIRAIAIADGDYVIEIGPGHGELTVPLLHAAQGKRCKMVCVEKDHTLAEALQPLLAKESPGNDTDATVKEGDALKLLPALTSEHYKIVGNIPYYITGKLLRIISELAHKPECVVFLIQKEVAERICAAPPHMNRLAASVQFWADPSIIMLVPRHDFSPPPDVDSAVIALKTRGEASVDPALYYRAIRGIFAQPRKTLLNNISEMDGVVPTKEEIMSILTDIGLEPGSRPQDLGISQLITIAKAPLWG